MSGVLTPGYQKPPRGVHIDRAHPLSRGIAAAYLFNEGTGILVNDLAGKNTGTVQGTVGSQWIAGRHGTSMTLNGTDNYIACGSSSLLNFVNTCSFSVWFNTTTTSALNLRLLSRAVGATGYEFYFQPSTKTLIFQNATGPFVGVTLTAYSGLWINAVATLDSNGLATLYTQGLARGSNSVFNLTQTSGILRLGTNEANNRAFIGILDGVTIWRNRVLTAGDVRSLYARPYQMFAPLMPDPAYFAIANAPWSLTGTLRLNRVLRTTEHATSAAASTITLHDVRRTAQTAVGHSADAITLHRVLRSAQAARGTSSDSVTLHRVLRTTQHATGTAHDTVTLSRALGVTQTARGHAADSITLHRILAISQTVIIFGPTPASRTFVVPADNRTFVVPTDCRTFTVN